MSNFSNLVLGLRRVEIIASPNSALTVSASATYLATTTSGQAVAANAGRRGMVIVNLGTVNVALGLGEAAIDNRGIVLVPNGTWTMDNHTYTTAAVNAKAASTTANLGIQEFT